MLQLNTIHKEIFALLKAISSYRELQDFSLADEAALALQLGHRISVDLDFFTQKSFDPDELFEFLRGTFTVNNCTQATHSLSLPDFLFAGYCCHEAECNCKSWL